MQEIQVQSWEIPWRKEWHPLQYSCLENPHGQKSLAGYSPWGPKESNMYERLTLSLHFLPLDLPSHPTPSHPPVGCAPCLCNLPPAICFTYGGVSMSVLLSQFITPSPSLTVATSLFPSLQIGSSELFLWLPFICINIWYFSLRLTSLCITDSKFIHFSSTHSNSFLLMGFSHS